MKLNELRKEIKDYVREALTVKTGGKVLTPQDQSRKIDQIKRSTGDQTIGTEKNPVNFIKEKKSFGIDLEEMARKSVTYEINPDMEEIAKSIKTGGPINPQRLADVIKYLKGKKTTTGPDIAAGLGFEHQMPRIYPIFAAMIEKGILIPTNGTQQVEVPETPENDTEEVEQMIDPEDEMEDTTPSGPPLKQTSDEFLKDNISSLKDLVKAYWNSRSRISSLDEEQDFNMWKKNSEEGSEPEYNEFNKQLNMFVNKMRRLSPDIQDEVLQKIYSSFSKKKNLGHVVRLMANKLRRNIILGSPEEPESLNEEVKIKKGKPKKK